MKNILSSFVSKQMSVYATVILIFTYNVLFDKNLACTCKQQTTQCILYMVLPFFIILFLILLSDRIFQRVWRYTCTCSDTCCCCDDCRLFCALVHHIAKAVCVGTLWVASVLIDGTWYVCWMNDQSEQQAQLACRDKSSITAEEKVIIADLKNYSKVGDDTVHYHLL